MRGVGPGIKILREKLGLRAQPAAYAGGKVRKAFRRHGLVDLAPPDIGAHIGVFHHEFILHGTAGVGAGHGNKSAISGKPAFIAAERLRNQRRRGEIRVNGFSPGHAGTGQSLCSNIHLKDTPPTNLR